MCWPRNFSQPLPARQGSAGAVLGLLPAPGRLPAPSPTAIPPFPASRCRPRCLRRPGAGVAALRHGRPRPSPPLPSPPVPFGPRGTHRVRGGAEVLEGQRAEDEAREQGRGALALHAPQWRPRRAARSPQRPAAAGQGRAGQGRELPPRALSDGIGEPASRPPRILRLGNGGVWFHCSSRR